MGVLLHGVPIEGKYGARYESCYASIRSNFSVVQRERFGKGFFLVANLTIFLSKEARDGGKEQLDSMQVVVPLPSSFPEVDATINEPYSLIYEQVHKDFPQCEDC